MRRALWTVLLTAPILFPADERLEAALGRLSEEAEAFARLAPEVIAQETWSQKSMKGGGRFPVRVGPAAKGPPRLSYRAREITSEYGFASIRDPEPSLHEVRRVVSVDGRKIESEAEARKKLTLALAATGDRERRKLLRDFERLGLQGALVDFGQCLLLFNRRSLANYEFAWSGSGGVGPDPALILRFRQRGGGQSLTVFEGSRVAHQSLEGRIWLRDKDFLPLRIEIRTARGQGQQQTVDLASVDYSTSVHGILVPASVRHTQHQGERLVVENSLRYSSFRRFAASAEIRFTEIEEPPPAKPPR